MTSTLRTAPAAGDPGEPGFSTLAGPEAFNLTLAGLDQSGRGGGHGLSFFCCAPAGVGQGELCEVGTRSGTLLASGTKVALDWGPSFIPLIRLLRCSKLNWTSSCFVFVWVGVLLVGRRAVPGFSRGFRMSGGPTGCCLARATGLLTYLALSASSLSTALCFGLVAAAGNRRK